MTLFQLLRHVLDIVPLAIFDIEGILVCKVPGKHKLPADLLDYDVFGINVISVQEDSSNRCYLCVMIRK